MLVCYESILTGESSALSSSVFHNWEVKVPALSQKTRQERGTRGSSGGKGVLTPRFRKSRM